MPSAIIAVMLCKSVDTCKNSDAKIVTKTKIDHAFFIESTIKVMLMSYSTLGIYNIYFFYKNFLNLQKNTHKIPPLLIIKAILYPLFCFSSLHKATQQFCNPNIATVLALIINLILILFVFSGTIFSGSLQYLSFVTFMPLTLINYLFSNSNSKNQTGDRVSSYFSATEKSIALTGSLLVSYLLLQ